MLEEQEMRERLSLLREKARLTHLKLQKAYDLVHAYEDRYYTLKAEYERLDRDLAMIDGRYEVVTGKREKTQSMDKLIGRLTAAQVMHLAAELGVELEVENGTG